MIARSQYLAPSYLLGRPSRNDLIVYAGEEFAQVSGLPSSCGSFPVRLPVPQRQCLHIEGVWQLFLGQVYLRLFAHVDREWFSLKIG